MKTTTSCAVAGVITLSFLSVGNSLVVQQAPDTRMASVSSVPADMLAGLRYRMIGPHRGGRVTAVAGVPGDHRTFYMGATGGGLWKTIDAGEIWENLSDRYFKTGAIGAIGIAPSDPHVIYVGTGSAGIRDIIQSGRGTYKSSDAGATWSLVGLESAGQISRIRVDPRDPNRVYVAAVGHPFGDNPDRGVFRSLDGGKNWQKVLYVNDKTGAIDLVQIAAQPDVLYAAMWSGVRHPWGMIAGSTDGGIFKSTDGGTTWNKLTQGLPQGIVGKIGLAISPAAPNRVYALIDAADGGLYRSDNAGQSFTLVSSNRTLTGRSWYYGHVFADTKNPDVIYIGNTDLYRSTDGGQSFNTIAMPHGDNHDLWIDPQDPTVMIEGNDGGATISLDGGRSWSSQLNQPTAEIYRVVTDDQVPYRVYGTQQDQYDGLSLPSRSSRFGERLQLQHWYAVGGMEGGYVAVVPHNPNIVYSGGSGAMITRLDVAAQHLRQVNVTPGGRGGNIRFAWSAPIFISPLEPDVVYHTSQFVHKTSDGGQTWQTISPDLTRTGVQHPTAAGGPGSEATSYPTISAFAESPRQKGVLWAGSDDGVVHVSRDGGATWKDVTPKDIPEWATVNTIEPSPHAPGRAYLAVLHYMLDDYRPYIYRTEDFGQTWTLLTDGANGIPADQPVRVVREDPVRPGLLYAGTEFGMFASLDDGKHWQSLQSNLPAVPITDIAVHDSDLALSTNGRSFWILDDISPLREMAVQSFTAPHLFPPQTTYRIATSADEDDQAYVGGACCVSNPRDLYTGARIERHRLGEEPPEGAILYASFPQGPTQPVKLEVLDSSQKVLRTLVDTGTPGGPAVRAGLNRYNWDLAIEPQSPSAGKPATRGPKAVPGAYTVRLTVGGQSQTASVRLLGDPRSGLTQQDYQAQYDVLSGIQEAERQIQEAAATIQKRRAGLQPGDPQAAKLDAIQAALGASAGGRGGRGGGGGGGRGAGRGANAGAAPPIAGEFSSLYTFVAGSEDRPTGAAEDEYKQLKQALAQQLAALNGAQP